MTTSSQTRPDASTNPPSDICIVPYTPNVLQGDLSEPRTGLRGRDVPKGRASEGRREVDSTQPTHGPRCYGRDDVRNEDTDGHDGAADGYYGLDQFLLPGFRLECVMRSFLLFVTLLTGAS